MHHDPNSLVEAQLNDRLLQVEQQLHADVITVVGPILYGLDDEIRNAVDGLSNKSEKLSVILETVGGYIEVARRIADTFRHSYKQVEFVIPNMAMSAGTILVMSGDAIYMDYYAILGPIDPQVQKSDSKGFVPALGYLEQFERLIDKANAGQLNSAEMAFLLHRFDPAELYQYEQERELSIDLLKEWLVKYKFKDWSTTETSGTPVTAEMKEVRAGEIAQKLNDTKKWHTHGRGIPMCVLVKDLKLKIEDFGAIRELNAAVRSYYKLLKAYMGVRSCEILVHTRESYNAL